MCSQLQVSMIIHLDKTNEFKSFSYYILVDVGLNILYVTIEGSFVWLT